MTYQHQSAGGERLRVEKSNIPTLTRIIVTDYQDDDHTVAISNKEAPNAACALLEESGIIPSNGVPLDSAEHYEQRALAHLQRARTLREEASLMDTAVQLRAAYSGLTLAQAREELVDNDPAPRRAGFLKAARWIQDTYNQDGTK